MYDVIILGGGASAMSAGIYATRRQMKTLLLSKDFGGQMMWASLIENYPGFESIPSSDLIEKFTAHAKASGVEMKLTPATEIKKMADGTFEVSTAIEKFQTKTIIVAIGAEHRQLGVPGEKEFSGRGVAHCANCDGPLFRNKTIAVVGGGNSALDSAEVLSKIATKVYIIHQFDVFQAFEALENKVRASSNIELVMNTKVEEVIGERKVTGVKVRSTKDDSLSEIKLDGIFVEVGFEVQTSIVADLVKLNDRKEIICNEKFETSEPGIFAAGDVTSGAYKQIVIATGQGAIAALSAYAYIQTKEGHANKLIK